MAVLLFNSCKKEVADSMTYKTEEIEIDRLEEIENTEDITKFLTELQGTWKRVDYPFSTLTYKESKQKLISEGMVEEPRFLDFEISKNCKYADEANVMLEPNEFIQITPTFEACELIKVYGDTLQIAPLDRTYKITYARQ